MAGDLVLEVQELLEGWGQWARADGHGLGYKSPMAMMMRGNVAETRKEPLTAMYLTDAEGLKVDELITLLSEHHPTNGNAMRLRYVERMSNRAIAREYLTQLKYGADSEKKVSPYKAAEILAFGEGFIMARVIKGT